MSFAYPASWDLASTSASTTYSEVSDQTCDPQLKPSEIFESKTTEGQSDGMAAKSKFLSTVELELAEVAKSEESLRSNSEICIYQVPHGLKEGNEKACNPRAVDLALYRRSDKHLRIQDKDKWRAFYMALQTERGKKPASVDAINPGNDLNSYLNALNNLEERARKCYEKPSPRNGKEPITILEGPDLSKRTKLNGCFVIEMLMGAHDGFETIGYRKDDFVFSYSMLNYIQRDMIKMENQIPFFVLDAVVGFHHGKLNHEGGTAPLIPKLETNSSRDLVGLITYFFDSLMPRPTEQTNATPTEQTNGVPAAEQTNATSTEQSNDVPAGFHCLDVYRRYLKTGLLDNDSTQDGPLPKRRMQLIPCATLLRDAGFTLKTIKTDCFLDIKFKKRTLQIPYLKIHEGTKSLFLNLIAFEQRHPGCSRTFTSYVCFIDNLIRSTEDVAFLRYCGIIENNTGKDDEVLKLLHSLLQDVVFDLESCYLKKLSQEVTQHYNSWWSAFRAWLIQYSKINPLFIIPWVVGIVSLLLGFTTFFYGAFGHQAKATNAVSRAPSVRASLHSN